MTTDLYARIYSIYKKNFQSLPGRLVGYEMHLEDVYKISAVASAQNTIRDIPRCNLHQQAMWRGHTTYSPLHFIVVLTVLN